MLTFSGHVGETRDTLVTHNLTKYHNGNSVHAVAGLNINIEPGQVVGLLGANGSGKSSILKVISLPHEPC